MQVRIPVPAILAVSLELLFVLSFRPLTSFFAARFSSFSVLNPVLVAAVYLLFCVAVFFIRKLETSGSAAKWSAKAGWLALPALCFGFLLLHVAAESGGFYRYLEVARNPAEEAWVPLLAIGGLGLALVYFFVIIVDIRPSIGPGLRREVVWAVCTVAAQLVIGVLAAWWRGLGAGSEPDSGIGTGGKILLFVAVYVFFLLFFASPRLLLLAAECNAASAVAFFAGTGYYVWATLSGTVWP